MVFSGIFMLGVFFIEVNINDRSWISLIVKEVGSNGEGW